MAIKKLNGIVSLWGECKDCKSPVSTIVDLSEFRDLSENDAWVRAEELLEHTHICQKKADNG
jgi:hypothetical protein